MELQPSHNNDLAIREVLTVLTASTREAISRKERLKAAAGKAAQSAGLRCRRRRLDLLLNAARPEIYRRLDIDFYEPRIATLTPAEQDVLLASAACGYPPLAVADLNEAVDKSPGNINVLLGRLVETGVFYRVRKGQYEYTAPKFREYLERRAASEA